MENIWSVWYNFLVDHCLLNYGGAHLELNEQWVNGRPNKPNIFNYGSLHQYP